MIARASGGDQKPEESCTPVTAASTAKLKAMARAHSVIGSFKSRKRTSTMPGHTHKNHSKIKGRPGRVGSTTFTSTAARPERTIITGHMNFTANLLVQQAGAAA